MTLDSGVEFSTLIHCAARNLHVLFEKRPRPFVRAGLPNSQAGHDQTVTRVSPPVRLVALVEPGQSREGHDAEERGCNGPDLRNLVSRHCRHEGTLQTEWFTLYRNAVTAPLIGNLKLAN
jgi:hypothetical protein